MNLVQRHLDPFREGDLNKYLNARKLSSSKSTYGPAKDERCRLNRNCCTFTRLSCGWLSIINHVHTTILVERQFPTFASRCWTLSHRPVHTIIHSFTPTDIGRKMPRSKRKEINQSAIDTKVCCCPLLLFYVSVDSANRWEYGSGSGYRREKCLVTHSPLKVSRGWYAKLQNFSLDRWEFIGSALVDRNIIDNKQRLRPAFTPRQASIHRYLITW